MSGIPNDAAVVTVNHKRVRDDLIDAVDEYDELTIALDEAQAKVHTGEAEEAYVVIKITKGTHS